MPSNGPRAVIVIKSEGAKMVYGRSSWVVPRREPPASCSFDVIKDGLRTLR
jgi:hypothetical protein